MLLRRALEPPTARKVSLTPGALDPLTFFRCAPCGQSFRVNPVRWARVIAQPPCEVRMTRQCECGCGELLKGTRARRFVDNAHRMRARKARIATERRTEGAAAAGGVPADRPSPPTARRAGLAAASRCGSPARTSRCLRCSSRRPARWPTNLYDLAVREIRFGAG
jgi:hypothetical protein